MAAEDAVKRDQASNGAWHGPIHGERGMLAVAGGRVPCHICGPTTISTGAVIASSPREFALTSVSTISKPRIAARLRTDSS
jgi:hypothetical protein